MSVVSTMHPLEGFSVGEIARVFSREPNLIRQRCKAEGRSAFHLGGLDRNPYPEKTAEAWWFTDGWLQERQEQS